MFTVVFQRPANNILVKGSEKTREKIIRVGSDKGGYRVVNEP
jgi:hypothetical protein